MRTKHDITMSTRGGLPFTVPAGAEVEFIPTEPGWYFVSPRTFVEHSIEWHDATYYGLRVLASEVTD